MQEQTINIDQVRMRLAACDQNGNTGPVTVWVGDHMRSDRMLLTPDGKYCRPYFTVFCDMLTGCLISWTMSLDYPDTERIINTFADGVIRHGLPKKVFVDDRRALALLSSLGVQAHLIMPFNTRAKVIERTFRNVKSGLLTYHEYDKA